MNSLAQDTVSGLIDSGPECAVMVRCCESSLSSGQSGSAKRVRKTSCRFPFSLALKSGPLVPIRGCHVNFRGSIPRDLFRGRIMTQNRTAGCRVRVRLSIDGHGSIGGNCASEVPQEYPHKINNFKTKTRQECPLSAQLLAAIAHHRSGWLDRRSHFSFGIILPLFTLYYVASNNLSQFQQPEI
jgi:hypothetical protein